MWCGGNLVSASSTGDVAILEECGDEDEGIVELKWTPRTSNPHTKKLFCLCPVSRDSFLSTGMDRQLALWRNGEVVHLAHGLGGFAYSLDISPLAPNRIAVGTGDNMLRLWWPDQNKVHQVSATNQNLFFRSRDWLSAN